MHDSILTMIVLAANWRPNQGVHVIRATECPKDVFTHCGLRHLACFSPAKSSAPPSKWSSYGNKLVKPKRVDDYPVDVDDMFRHGGAGGRAPLQKLRARNQLVIDQDLHVSASF